MIQITTWRVIIKEVLFDKLAVGGAGKKGDKEGGCKLNADQRIKG